MNSKLINKINSCTTMPELDAMRLELVQSTKGSPDDFRTVQEAFIKKKNQLKRVPMSQRSW